MKMDTLANHSTIAENPCLLAARAALLKALTGGFRMKSLRERAI